MAQRFFVLVDDDDLMTFACQLLCQRYADFAVSNDDDFHRFTSEIEFVECDLY